MPLISKLQSISTIDPPIESPPSASLARSWKDRYQGPLHSHVLSNQEPHGVPGDGPRTGTGG